MNEECRKIVEKKKGYKKLAGFNFVNDCSDGLKKMDLSNTDLTNCNFKGLSIELVDFSGSYLYGADFSDSELVGVNFEGAKMGLSQKAEASLLLICCLTSFVVGIVLTFALEFLVTLLLESATVDPDTDPLLNYASILFNAVNPASFFIFSSLIIFRWGFGVALSTFLVIFTILNVVFMAVISTDAALSPIFHLPLLAVCLSGGIAHSQATFLKAEIKRFAVRERFRVARFLNKAFFGSLIIGTILGEWLTRRTNVASPDIFMVIIPTALVLFLIFFGNHVFLKADHTRKDDYTHDDEDGYELIRRLPTSLIEGTIPQVKSVISSTTSFRDALAVSYPLVNALSGSMDDDPKPTTFKGSSLSRSDFSFVFIGKNVDLAGSGVDNSEAKERNRKLKRSGENRVYNFVEIGGDLVNTGNLAIQSDVKQTLLTYAGSLDEEYKRILEAVLEMMKEKKD